MSRKTAASDKAFSRVRPQYHPLECAKTHERFQGEFTGKMTVDEHIAHCRSIAEDFRKVEQQNKTLSLLIDISGKGGHCYEDH